MVGIVWLRHDIAGATASTVAANESATIAGDQMEQGTVLIHVNGATATAPRVVTTEAASSGAIAVTCDPADLKGRQ